MCIINRLSDAITFFRVQAAFPSCKKVANNGWEICRNGTPLLLRTCALIERMRHEPLKFIHHELHSRELRRVLTSDTTWLLCRHGQILG